MMVLSTRVLVCLAMVHYTLSVATMMGVSTLDSVSTSSMDKEIEASAMVVHNDRNLLSLPSSFEYYNGFCRRECSSDETGLFPFLNACPQCPEKYDSVHCNKCCQGGASSLKFKWHGCPGTITFATLDQALNDCGATATTAEHVRFVDCHCYDRIADPRTFDPFQCPLVESYTVTETQDSICIVSMESIDVDFDVIDLSKPLPSILGLVHTFPSNYDTTRASSESLTTYFDTTCEASIHTTNLVYPIFPGYGKLPNTCADYGFIDLLLDGDPLLPVEVEHLDGAPEETFWYEFIDGTSTAFWPHDIENMSTTDLYLDPTFAKCTCLPCSASPSLAPSVLSPSTSPSTKTDTPSVVPSIPRRPGPVIRTSPPTHFEAPSTSPQHPASAVKTVEPTKEPTPSPTNAVQVTNEPSVEPVSASFTVPVMVGKPNAPSEAPVTEGLASIPSRVPTVRPTQVPTTFRTNSPSEKTTTSPAPSIHNHPSNSPSWSTQPSVQPSSVPTVAPTQRPTKRPTFSPSGSPSARPSIVASIEPSVVPSESPTADPTTAPTMLPTERPSKLPTASPAPSIHNHPSISPSWSTQPSVQPSSVPTVAPTPRPTKRPTSSPSDSPSARPSIVASIEPSVVPSESPTADPTTAPTMLPTERPSELPTASPAPSIHNHPSNSPSRSTQPSKVPTAGPSVGRTAAPSRIDSSAPSTQRRPGPGAKTAPPASPPTPVVKTVEPTKETTASPFSAPLFTDVPSDSPTHSLSADCTSDEAFQACSDWAANRCVAKTDGAFFSVEDQCSVPLWLEDGRARALIARNYPKQIFESLKSLGSENAKEYVIAEITRHKRLLARLAAKGNKE